MFLSKMKLVTLSLLAVALMCAGAGVVRYQRLAAQPPAPKQAGEPADEAAKPQQPEEVLADADVEALKKALSEVLADADVEALKKALSEATDLSGKLKRLLRERLEAIRTATQARWQDFLAGRGILELLFRVSAQLRDAELEMSPKRTDQIAALEAHWKRMQRIEEINKTRFDTGRIPIQEYEHSRYYRLNAEIQLERAKVGKLPRVEN